MAKKEIAQFGVSIQKVLEMMKPIVDKGKEAEFLQKCRVLGDDRFVVVNAKIIALVKKFHAKHELGDNRRVTAKPSSKMVVATDDDQTCFKHSG